MCLAIAVAKSGDCGKSNLKWACEVVLLAGSEVTVAVIS